MKKLTFLAILLLVSLVTMGQQEVTIPDGVTPEEYTLEITHAMPTESGNVPQSKKITALVAFDGTDVYLQGLAYYFPKAYVKGTLAEGVITVPTGQYLGADMYGAEYLLGYVLNEQQQMVTKDILFNYDATEHTITYDPSVEVAEIGDPDPETGSVNTYAFLASAKYTPGGLPPLVPVEIPSDLKKDSYLLIGTRTLYDEDESGERVLVKEKCQQPVNVGFYGDDLYIQGMVENVNYGWAKATKNDNGKYVIPSGQYIGSQTLYGQTWDYFLSSITRMGNLSDIVFTYDNKTNTLTNTQTIGITTAADKPETYSMLNTVQIKKVEEREAIPSAPEITFMKTRSYTGGDLYSASIFIPLIDTKERPMLADKVFYVFFKEKDGEVSPVTFTKPPYYMLEKDITEIPYYFQAMPDFSNHLVYFEKIGINELKTWKRLGLQTIYRGADVEHKSDIAWFNLEDFWKTAGITTVDADRRNAQSAIYNLSGQRVDNPQKGLYIVNGKKTVIK